MDNFTENIILIARIISISYFTCFDDYIKIYGEETVLLNKMLSYKHFIVTYFI